MNMQPIAARISIDLVSLSDDSACSRIDAYVCEHPDGQIFQRPAWLRAVARGCGQEGMFLVARERGMLVGVVPITRMRSALFGRALVSSGFGVGGGILAEPAAARALADALWARSRAERYASVELRGGSDPGAGWDVHADAHAGFARDLASDDDAELLAIPRKQRAEVRKAIGFALDVEVGRDGRNRDAHYAVYAASVRNLGTPVFPRRLFAAMLDAFGDRAEIMTIRRDGVALASVLSLRHGDTIMPYWGGGTTDARSWRANDALYWALMRRARELGCTRFDFGRSKVGSGAYAFKKNWGFAPEPMRYWTRGTRRDVSPNDARYSRKIELWKKLPLPIANLVGPFISRGLG